MASPNRGISMDGTVQGEEKLQLLRTLSNESVELIAGPKQKLDISYTKQEDGSTSIKVQLIPRKPPGRKGNPKPPKKQKEKKEKEDNRRQVEVIIVSPITNKIIYRYKGKTSLKKIYPEVLEVVNSLNLQNFGSFSYQKFALISKGGMFKNDIKNYGKFIRVNLSRIFKRTSRNEKAFENTLP